MNVRRLSLKNDSQLLRTSDEPLADKRLGELIPDADSLVFSLLSLLGM